MAFTHEHFCGKAYPCGSKQRQTPIVLTTRRSQWEGILPGYVTGERSQYCLKIHWDLTFSYSNTIPTDCPSVQVTRTTPAVPWLQQAICCSLWKDKYSEQNNETNPTLRNTSLSHTGNNFFKAVTSSEQNAFSKCNNSQYTYAKIHRGQSQHIQFVSPRTLLNPSTRARTSYDRVVDLS